MTKHTLQVRRKPCIMLAKKNSEARMKRLFLTALFTAIALAMPALCDDAGIYSSKNLAGHEVADEWLGGKKIDEKISMIKSFDDYAEVTSNPNGLPIYVNAIGHKKFVEKFPLGQKISLGTYRYTVQVKLPVIPKTDAKQKANPQAVHTMIQLWDGRDALYKAGKKSLEAAIYWEINPWLQDDFCKIKVYTKSDKPGREIMLVDTGIRLKPDTEWHTFTLVANFEEKRYVSITIDGETKDLENIPLAEVAHPDWGNEVAFVITTESLAGWSKDYECRFTWTTLFRDVKLDAVAK